jgi:hypothetical protein
MFDFQTISNLPFSQQVRSVQHLQLAAPQVLVVIQVGSIFFIGIYWSILPTFYEQLFFAHRSKKRIKKLMT